MGRKKKIVKRLEEALLRKFDQLSLEESIQFGLWITTSLTTYPILKASADITSHLGKITNLLESFTPYRGEFLTSGAVIIRDLILGKVNPATETVEASDLALILLSVLISYYVVYRPRILAELGTNITGMGKILIGS